MVDHVLTRAQIDWTIGIRQWLPGVSPSLLVQHLYEEATVATALTV